MRGLETRAIYGLIILMAIIILTAIIVFGPSLAFGKSTQSKTKFEEFCIFWSLDNYAEGWGEEVNALPQSFIPRTPGDYCPTVLGTTSQDIDTCRRCCKKEVVC